MWKYHRLHEENWSQRLKGGWHIAQFKLPENWGKGHAPWPVVFQPKNPHGTGTAIGEGVGLEHGIVRINIHVWVLWDCDNTVESSIEIFNSTIDGYSPKLSTQIGLHTIFSERGLGSRQQMDILSGLLVPWLILTHVPVYFNTILSPKCNENIFPQQSLVFQVHVSNLAKGNIAISVSNICTIHVGNHQWVIVAPPRGANRCSEAPALDDSCLGLQLEANALNERNQNKNHQTRCVETSGALTELARIKKSIVNRSLLVVYGMCFDCWHDPHSNAGWMSEKKPIRANSTLIQAPVCNIQKVLLTPGFSLRRSPCDINMRPFHSTTANILQQGKTRPCEHPVLVLMLGVKMKTFHWTFPTILLNKSSIVSPNECTSVNIPIYSTGIVYASQQASTCSFSLSQSVTRACHPCLGPCYGSCCSFDPMKVCKKGLWEFALPLVHSEQHKATPIPPKLESKQI